MFSFIKINLKGSLVSKMIMCAWKYDFNFLVSMFSAKVNYSI